MINADDLSDLSSDEEDDEKMDDVDLVPEIDTPAFRAQAFPEIKSKAQLTYRQLFSPTMAKVALMMMLYFAVANNEFIFIADVSTAFLHAYLYPDEQLFCRPPGGFENHSVFGGKVVRLVKALYGARQAGRRFWKHLYKVFSTTMGMTRWKSDPCLWILMRAKLHFTSKVYLMSR